MLSRLNPFVRGKRFTSLLKTARATFSVKNQAKLAQKLVHIPHRKMGQMETAEASQKHEAKDLIKDTPRGLQRRPYDLKVGDTIHGFTVKSVEDITDFNIKAFTLEHDETGAKYLHLDSADLENVFMVRFKTFPNDSTGIPHILEHLSLCGSKNFPVRDPFFKMIKRSLNTFMNAWTGSDFTGYPFSTCNEKDFNNLLRVYLDACFFPNLKRTDFNQEGYRYEFEEPGNPDSALQIKGVVYNEMKGVMSNADRLFLHKLSEHMFEKSCYHHNSGGDPNDIPLLKYETLKKFHEDNYHPSNSYFMTYGDLDFTNNLEYLNRNVFTHFERNEQNQKIELEDRRTSPKVKTEYFMPELVSDAETQGKLGISYLCNEVNKDNYETFCLYIMSSLFFDGPDTPFYQSIIESGLAPAFCPGVGYDTSTKEGTFTFGVSNITPSNENIRKIQKAIDETILQIYEEGIPEDKFEAQLHQVELQVKRTRQHWGLGTISNMLSYTVHDKDPLAVFKLNQYLERIRKDFKEGLFRDLMSKYLIKNKHKITLHFLPDPTIAEKEQLKESLLLEGIAKNLSKSDKERLIKEAAELKEDQEALQDIEKLPGLTLDDISPTIEYVDFNQSKIGEAPVFWFEQPTNGITHVRAKFNISHLPEELKPLLPAFCKFFTEVGTKNYDYKKFHTLMQATTGGLGLQADGFSLSADLDDSHEHIVVSLCFLDRNADKAMTYFSEILATPNFDNKSQLSDLIKNSSVEVANNIGNNSLDYGLSFASSGLKKYARNMEKLKADLFFCQLGAEVLSTSSPKGIYEDLIYNLTDLASYIIREENVSFAVTGDKKKFSFVEMKLQMVMNAIFNENSRAREKLNHTFVTDQGKFEPIYYQNFFETPLKVNNCVESFVGPGYYSDVYAHSLILGSLLTHEFFLPNIREKGGAYGAGASANESGTFNFYSFWDPKLEETYENFERGLQAVCDGNFSEKQLDQAKLVTFQKLDKVLEPSLKGMVKFTRGYTDEQLINHRNLALNCTRGDIQHIAEAVIMPQLEKGESSRVVFGAQSDSNEGLKTQGWKIEKPLEFLSSSYFDKYKQS